MSRTVDTKEYISALAELIRDGREVSLPISGSSMIPFLSPGRDTVFLKRMSGEPKRGDIVLFERKTGDYVLHRVQRASPDGLYICGDAQETIEGPVERGQIIAFASKVRRKGEIITPASKLWKFFSGAWLILIPVRHTVMALIRKFR